MSYPILKTSKAQTVGWQVQHALELNPNAPEPLQSSFMGLEKEIEYRQGGDWNEIDFFKNLNTFERTMREDKQNGDLTRVKMEEDFAEHFMSQVELISDTALQDPDFWRYLSLFPYRRYIYQLEKDLTPKRFGGHGNRDLVRWTLIRGYLWGARTFEPENDGEERFEATRAYRYAREDAGFGKKSEDTVPDFYISQIIRRYWKYNKPTYLGFIRAVVQQPLVFDLGDEIRDTQTLAALVGRISSNIYLPSLSEDDIFGVVLEEKAKLPDRKAALKHLQKSD
jgi:hypothetical protein